MNLMNEYGQPLVLAASTVVSTKSCLLIGIFITSANATSRIWISQAASAASAAATTMIRKFVSSAGKFYRIPADMPGGMTVNMTGSAQVVTVFWKPNAGAPV